MFGNRKKDERRLRRARRLVLAYIGGLLFILLLAYIFLKLWWPIYAANISINYYITLAGVLPVLLVALFLAETKRNKKGMKSGWRLMLSEGKTEGLVGFTVGEVACLIAIAINHSKTSLFVASMFGLLIMVMITFQRIVYGAEE